MADRPEFSRGEHGKHDLTVACRLLDEQIKHHERADKSRSLLSKGVNYITDLVCTRDKESLASLKELRRQISAVNDPTSQEAGHWSRRVKLALTADEKLLSWRSEISLYGTGFLKTAALFLPGKAGLLGAASTYGIDRVKLNDDSHGQLLDGCLGGLTGALLSKTFSALGARSINLGPAGKGVLMGLGARAIELGLDRKTWSRQGEDGFDAIGGITRWGEALFNRRAIVTDIAAFSAAHGLTAAGNRAAGGLLERNLLFHNFLTGTSFGMTNGALREVERQRASGEDLDVLRVTGRALFQGGLDGVAALGSRTAYPLCRQGASTPAIEVLRGKLLARSLRSNANLLREVEDESRLNQEVKPNDDSTSAGNKNYRFNGFDREQMYYKVAASEGPFASYDEFLNSGVGVISPQMRVYKIPGLPETRILYADREASFYSYQKAGRIVRANADKIDLTKFSGQSRANIENMLRDEDGLEEHRLASRLSPKQALEILRELPDPRLIKDITILNQRFWEEPWIRQNGGDNTRIMAEVSPDRSVKLFSPSNDETSRSTLFHEWSHILKQIYPKEGRLVDSVGALERFSTNSCSDTSRSPEELWAVLVGEELLNRSFFSAVTAAHENPIRSTIAATALAKVLKSVPSSLRGPRHEQHEALVNYIDENVRPRAEEALRSRYQESDADAKGRVEALLRHLGDRTNFLTNSKLESGTPELSVRQKDAALQIVSELQRHGHQAVLVGGCVRDELVGRSPKDYDIATSARPEEVLSLFASSERTGSKSGPVRVFANNLPCEVSTFRSESKDGKHYLNADSDALALDAARRDLTITAMSRDPVSGKIYDFFGGQKDIENRTIRAVGDPEVRVSEDPFRMLRAVRMAAELGFQLEPKLEEAIKRNAYRINGIRYDAQQERNAFKDRENSVPGDKVRDELLKILGSKNPVLGLDLLMETGLMREILPEVADTNTERGEQDPRWHPEGNTWVHTRAVLEIMSRNGADAELMLAGLLHDIGKPRTQERYADGRITNKLHAEVGADMAYGIVRRFDMSQARTNRLATIVRMHMLMHQGDQLRQGRLGALLENPYIDDLILLQDADAQVGSPVGGRGSLKSFFTRKREEFTARANETARLDAPPLVTGRMLVELGHKPGPEFKRMLAEAREHQIEGVFQTEDEARAWARKHFSAR